MQSVRQREQILRLILENEKVRWPWTFGSQTVSQRDSQAARDRQSARDSQPERQSVSQRDSQSVTVSSDHSLYRLTRLLTSPALPWKRKASQEVTSERCVGTLHCCVCGTLCTCQATGSSWTHPHLCVSAGTSKQWFPEVWLPFTCLPVCLSVSQANRRISPLHQSLRSSEIHHKVEEVQVGGRSRCSAARCPGLTGGHMTTSQFCRRLRDCTGVDGAVVMSHRCHLSTPESLTSWIAFLLQRPRPDSAHIQAPPTWFLHAGQEEMFLFSFTLIY